MFGFATSLSLPSMMKPSSLEKQSNSSLFYNTSRRSSTIKNRPIVPVARLFGPAIFEASKLKVLFLGVDEKKHPAKLPRTYTLTHSDITAKLTLAISQSINNSQLQGWANKLFRDEVVAEWKKVKGKMSLHVHCHISGGHFLLDPIAKLRYYIFCKELPVVLKAFVHGDGNLLSSYPELQESLVWVYFHSDTPDYDKVECWGPLWEATQHHGNRTRKKSETLPELPCPGDCKCCFPSVSAIPWSQRHYQNSREDDEVPDGLMGISIPNTEKLK
ncbi:unnamed protein product [Cochlearia groenlandica]